MKPKYYIFASDPHGNGQPWIDNVNRAKAAYPDSKIIFGGDYIDGGKHVKETVNFVMDRVKNHNDIALIGNHEILMHDFVEKDDAIWYINGAKKTVKSLFGRGFSKTKTQHMLRSNDYYMFLTSLPTTYVTDHLIFVHAGLTQRELHLGKVINNVPFQDDPNYEDHTWAREDYWYSYPKRNCFFAHNNTKHTIVTGHTPTMLIYGDYETTDAVGEGILPTANIFGKDDFTHRPCPVIKIQYKNESPRYFTDDGCHGNNQHHGNICVFNTNGELVETFNSDPKEEPFEWNDWTGD